MKCPDCRTTLSTKHYDAEFEWYECPKCEGCFTADEIEEASSGTSLAKRSGKKPVKAKAKKRQEDEDEALAKADKISLTKKESQEIQVTKHRDEVSSKQVREIMADEIQDIGHELGIEINRLNAVEFYAYNLWLALHVKNSISARDKEVPMVKCGEHT